MPRRTTSKPGPASGAAGAASSMEALPVLPATAEPADLSQPAAAVVSCATFGMDAEEGDAKEDNVIGLVDGICWACCGRPSAEPIRRA